MSRAATLFLMCLLVGIMISFFSPSVTFRMDPNYRLEFWIILCLVAGAGIFFCGLFIEYAFPKCNLALKAVFEILCGAIAVLVPVFSIYDPAELPSVSKTILFVGTVVALIVAGNFILHQMFKRPKELEPSVSPGATLTSQPSILSRLPVHLQNAELYALSAEDHYVRVHTSKGEDILLMRLSDSIAEAGGVEGSQVHRSWWVAKNAVAGVTKLGRTGEIKLRNGLQAPVSRSGLKTLKEIGWL